MAARKSCTHLTWSEAKNKVGEGSGGAKKKNAGPKMSHDQILCDKIIKKSGFQKEKDKVADRQAARKSRKEMEYIQKVERMRREEKEQKIASQLVKPYEQARERMKELALQRQQQDGKKVSSKTLEMEELKLIAECKQTQLDEIMALEAIYMGETDMFLVSEACELENLREKMEELDDGDEASLRSVSLHPLLQFTIQLIIDDPSGGDLDACVLLDVTLPQYYPERDTTPIFEVAYCMVTDKSTVCSANKPLESLGYLQQPNLDDGILAEAKMILPDPCVYEIAATFLPEKLFSEFLVLNARQ